MSALILAQAVALVWLVLVVLWWIDRYEEGLLADAGVAFTWGGLVEVIFILMPRLAGLTGVHGLSWFALHHVTGLIPVILQIVGLLAIVRLGRGADGPVDLFVYGAVMGAGFGTLWLLVQVVLAHVSRMANLSLAHVSGEVFLGLLWSMLVSGAAGAMLGFGRLRSSFVVRLLWLVGAFAIAAGISLGIPRLARWLDIPARSSLAVELGAVIVLVCVLLGLLYWGERRILRRELEEEAELGVVPGWVPEIVPFYVRRIRSRWWPERRERTVLARLLSRLAFRKYSLRAHRRDGSELAGLEIVKIREHLRSILAPSDNPEL
ncbi:MAG: hypothetical protein GXP48_09610 [Acidobacteria bacterium]|nr:hypothetical protein [Acidobacteriota bacterium]